MKSSVSKFKQRALPHERIRHFCALRDVIRMADVKLVRHRLTNLRSNQPHRFPYSQPFSLILPCKIRENTTTPTFSHKNPPTCDEFRRMRAGLFFYSPMLHQYSFDPAGMWSSTMSRCRSSLPSFWLTALMTMPQLSMPIILRGGRLVMAMRVLPMSSSGS